MTLDVFELKSRQSLAKTSGIVLDRELLLVYQAIENVSTRQNLNKAMVFSPTPEKLEGLKISKARFREVIRDLIDFQLIVQVFELVFNQDTSQLELVSYFLTETESLRDTSVSYSFFLDRSLKEINRYAKEASVMDQTMAHKIAYNLASGNPDGYGSKLSTLFADSSFLIPPPRDFTKRFLDDLKVKIEEQNEILGEVSSNVYSVNEDNADEIFDIFLNEFEAKLLPYYRLKNTQLHEKLEDLEREESVSEKNLDYHGEWSFARKTAEICLGYPGVIQSHGKLFINSLVKLSIIAERYFFKKEKEVKDRIALKILKALDGGEDLDSLFLRINLEDTGDIPKNVVDSLRVDREVLNAEWYTSSHKLIIFCMKKPANLKKINQIIHDQYRNTTEYPLYLRALLESNEKDVYEVFQDSEFVRVYGKSLQAVYLRYIPFFYRIFSWLGISSLTNTGYTKAKSIIKFKQMDRQFQYEKRHEKHVKERMKARLEDLARGELIKYRSYLTQALHEMYFFEKTIPTSEDISNKYPALIPLMIEKVCKEFQFRVIEDGGFAGGNMIVYPKTQEFEDKNRELLYITREILSDDGNFPEDTRSRAALIQKFLP